MISCLTVLSSAIGNQTEKKVVGKWNQKILFTLFFETFFPLNHSALPNYIFFLLFSTILIFSECLALLPLSLLLYSAIYGNIEFQIIVLRLLSTDQIEFLRSIFFFLWAPPNVYVFVTSTWISSWFFHFTSIHLTGNFFHSSESPIGIYLRVTQNSTIQRSNKHNTTQEKKKKYFLLPNEIKAISWIWNAPTILVFSSVCFFKPKFWSFSYRSQSK